MSKFENMDETSMQPIVTKRSRPTVWINDVRLTLERGDGECIDVGELPDFRSSMDIARFLVRLQDADKAIGTYSFHDTFLWTPRQLEFHVTDVAK